MAWFEHDYLTISNGAISKTLPWHSAGNSWYDGDYALARQNISSYRSRWIIYDYTQEGVISVSTTTFYKNRKFIFYNISIF